MRSKASIVLAAMLITAACDSDTTGPDNAGEGVNFGISGTGSHSAVGNPQPDNSGTILSNEFAVARPDSVGGFGIISFEPTESGKGNLFVLQAPRQTGTYECTRDVGPCHGRLIMGVRNDEGSSGNTAQSAAGELVTTGDTLVTGNNSVLSYDRYFPVIEGSLTVTAIGPSRVKGTFRLTLEELNNPANRIVIENGTIDVPYVDSQVTDGAIQCLLSLVGIGQGKCRA